MIELVSLDGYVKEEKLYFDINLEKNAKLKNLNIKGFPIFEKFTLYSGNTLLYEIKKSENDALAEILYVPRKLKIYEMMVSTVPAIIPILFVEQKEYCLNPANFPLVMFENHKQDLLENWAKHVDKFTVSITFASPLVNTSDIKLLAQISYS